jgi:hypothetical protein
MTHFPVEVDKNVIHHQLSLHIEQCGYYSYRYGLMEKENPYAHKEFGTAWARGWKRARNEANPGVIRDEAAFPFKRERA